MTRRSQKRMALVLILVLAVALVVSLALAFFPSVNAAPIAPVSPVRTLPYYAPEPTAQSF